MIRTANINAVIIVVLATVSEVVVSIPIEATVLDFQVASYKSIVRVVVDFLFLDNSLTREEKLSLI